MPKNRATKQEIEKRTETVITLMALGKNAGTILEHLTKTEGISLRQAQRYYAQALKQLVEYGEQPASERLGIIRKKNGLLQKQAMTQKDLKAFNNAIKNEIQLFLASPQHFTIKGEKISHELSSIESTTPSSELEELLAAFREECKSTVNKTNE